MNEKDEITVLQEIIDRHEKHLFTLWTWFSSTQTAIAVAFLFGVGDFRSKQYLVLTVSLLVFYVFITLLLRVAKTRAIRRVNAIEEQLRLTHPYDGPMISSSLTGRVTFSEMSAEFCQGKVWGTVLLILVLLVVIGNLSTPCADPVQQKTGKYESKG